MVIIDKIEQTDNGFTVFLYAAPPTCWPILSNMINWLLEHHIKFDYPFFNMIYLYSEEDVMAFKLRWG